MATRILGQNKTKGCVARVHLIPAKCIRDGLGIGPLLIRKLLVDFIFGKINELAMIREFFDIVIHGGNVPSQQLVDASVDLVLKKERAME